jgi:hypothetical protein
MCATTVVTYATIARLGSTLTLVVLFVLNGPSSTQGFDQVRSQGPSGTDPPIADFSAFAGHWVNEQADASGPRPRWPEVLDISVSPTQITLNKGYASQAYRLDGVSTDFGNELFGSLLVLPEGVALVTRRQAAANSNVTIFVAVVRADVDTLIIDERLSSALPDGRLVRITGAARLTHMTYRRISATSK